MNIELKEEGRRVYVLGNSYPIKDQIKGAGGHWDGERKAWWIGSGKRQELESAIAKLGEQPARSEDEKYDGEVQGKAEYKGRSYFIRWHGETAHGESFRLVTFDGLRSFWAAASEVRVTKHYEAREPRGFYGRRSVGRATYPTLSGIRNYVRDVKSGAIEVCPMCGKSNCDSFSGGLCEND